VGLSLEEYDQSVVDIYINTILLALLCIFFSFLLSLLYARRMVRPIHRLRDVVQKVAGGDLDVRADEVRRDELGDLADSINIMIRSLLRRDRIMESVRFAGRKLMLIDSWADAINDILAKIGQATDASRAYFFENRLDDDDRLLCSLRYEWAAKGICARLPSPDLQDVAYSDYALDRWIERLSSGRIICGVISDLSRAEQFFPAAQNTLSIIVVPVFFEGTWRGFLGLDDCETARIWTDTDKESLRAIADLVGATHSRQLFQKALLESKVTLEQRVHERTRELRDQVIAKENALADLAEAQSSLLEASRSAGMAEVATGVLHNVGNVLNSVNVSCTLIRDQLKDSRVGNVSRTAGLLAEHEGRLVQFLSDDPRGRRIPAYLLSLGSALEEENQTMSREAESLYDRMEHIKEIVNMQQNYGRFSGVEETVAPEQLMEDALNLNSGSLARHQVTVQRAYEPVAPLITDKHKVLQILLNLINNAKYACDTNGGSDKVVTLRIFAAAPDRVIMQVSDNGMGIAPENLTRIFRHGFTTRKTGHGYGLHSGALAAKELGGSLNAHSDGPGRGATFTLELPHSLRRERT
jgi:signal transduction histidine kinase